MLGPTWYSHFYTYSTTNTEQNGRKKKYMIIWSPNNFSLSRPKTCDAAFSSNTEFGIFCGCSFRCVERHACVCVVLWHTRTRHGVMVGAVLDRRRIGQQNTEYFWLDVWQSPLRNNSPDAFIELVESSREQRKTKEEVEENTRAKKSIYIYPTMDAGMLLFLYGSHRKKENWKKKKKMIKITFLFSARFGSAYVVPTIWCERSETSNREPKQYPTVTKMPTNEMDNSWKKTEEKKRKMVDEYATNLARAMTKQHNRIRRVVREKNILQILKINTKFRPERCVIVAS